MKVWRVAALGAMVCGMGAAMLWGQQGPGAAAPTGAMHHDVIDLSRTYQTLNHFGASDAWTMQRIGAWSEENRKKFATLLFSQTEGIGLSCWRFNLGGGIVNDRRVINPARTVETFETGEGEYDWTRQKNERNVLADAKGMGVPMFVAFVNSPPRRMTVNGLTNSWESPAATQAAATQPGVLSAFTASTNLKPGFEKQYARYLVDILEHFRTNADESQRITFDWVSPVNEPTVDWNSGQEGCRYSDDDIKRVGRAVHEELSSRGSPTKMLLVEAPTYSTLVRGTNKHNARYGNFVDVLVGDQTFAPLLSGVLAHHAYGSDDPVRNLLQDREAFARRMGAHSDAGVVSWMSEYCVLKPGRDLGMGYALAVARVMWADFTVSGDSAWDWWLAVSDGRYEDGLLYTDWRRAGDKESIIVPKMFWAFGNYSRFVRPGMVRVDLSGEKHEVAGLEGSAWMDKKTGRVVVVYVNSGADSQTVELGVKNGTVGGWTAYVTSDKAGDDLRKEDLRGAEVTLPGRSVVTLVGQ